MKAPMATLAIMTATLIAWTAMPSDAARAEAWAGRATANVNLRAAPSLQGAVITGLVQGTVLEVQEEKDGWIKVAHQNDGFGYQGWVYAQYVKPVDAAVPLAAPLTEAVGIQPQTESAAAPSPPLVPAKARMEAAPVVPAPSPAPPSVSSANAENTAKPQANRILTPPPVVKPATPATAASNLIPNTGPDKDILFTERSPVAETAAAASAPAKASTGKEGVLSWLSLLLRLSTVLLATLALVTANRALQTARAASLSHGRF